MGCCLGLPSFPQKPISVLAGRQSLSLLFATLSFIGQSVLE
jgi:hypothetical protein